MHRLLSRAIVSHALAALLSLAAYAWVAGNSKLARSTAGPPLRTLPPVGSIRAPSKDTGPPPGGAGTGFESYGSIVRARLGDTDQVYVFTGATPYAEPRGIGCVDAYDGRWRWRRPALDNGQYNFIEVGGATLVECSGNPHTNDVGVRRLSDGRLIGRAWRLGAVYDVAISGRRVAVVEPVIVHRGREAAVDGPVLESEGREVTRLRVYDEWGHVLSSRRIPDITRVVGFPRGFAVVSDAGTTILSSTGRRVATLR
jgi:hypothetical protein